MLKRIIPGISWMSLRLPYSACGSALLFGKKIPRLPGWVAGALTPSARLASFVAVACLSDAVVQEKIDQDSVVLLNVTGGGRRRIVMDYPLVQAEPMLRLSRQSLFRGRYRAQAC